MRSSSKGVQTADIPVCLPRLNEQNAGHFVAGSGKKGCEDRWNHWPDNLFTEWNLLRTSPERRIVKVVTIKHPPDAIDGRPPDNSTIGKIYDLPPQLAILMIAAGWMRGDTRSRIRRNQDQAAPMDRRHTSDRRSVGA
jgi:hypothetical protein